MSKLRITLNKIILFIYTRKQITVLILSLLSFIIVFFNLIGISVFLEINNMYIFQFFFKLICLLSTAFIVIFLPFYPLFFIIFRNKNFNFLEKISLTIVANLTLYILSAYLGNIFEIPITGYFFFLLTLVIYFSLLIFIIIYEERTKTSLFLKVEEFSVDKQSFYESFSILNYFKRRIPLSGILVVIFLILMSILNGVRFSYFYGTDAMYHIFMVKLINNLNYLPVDQYFGALGLHLFAALIHFFTGIDHLLLAQYFSFYTFLVSGLLIYNILKRIFKNRNLAILGVFLVEFTSLGFSNTMYQFWPTSLASIQSLYIFFLLYVRLENFVKEEPPRKKEIFSNLTFTYIFIILIYISALFTHSLIATIYVVSFAFIFLIYFTRSYKRGIDFVILCTCLGAFVILFNISGISAHWTIVDILGLPWYFLVIGGVIAFLIVLKLRSGIKFEKNRFKLVISGQKYGYYKKIEDKLIFPIFLSFSAIFLISALVVNYNFLDLYFSRLLIALEFFIMIFFGTWGLILFQKNPRGKSLLLWLFGMTIIYLAAFSLDVFVLHEFWSGRILLLISPVLIFGFISYLYKLIKLNSITTIKIKIFILSVVIFTFFAQFSNQLFDIDDKEYSLHKREVYSLQWYSRYTSDVNFIICEFGIPYVVMYFEYPYEEHNKSILLSDLIHFKQAPKGYFKPADHFYPNGTNKLQQMKEDLNTDIYLILDDNYMAFTGFDVFERLTEEEMEEYYSMDYMNKICSSKSENGIEFPYYWVI